MRARRSFTGHLGSIIAQCEDNDIGLFSHFQRLGNLIIRSVNNFGSFGITNPFRAKPSRASRSQGNDVFGPALPSPRTHPVFPILLPCPFTPPDPSLL